MREKGNQKDPNDVKSGKKIHLTSVSFSIFPIWKDWKTED
jgi:hypothetical protein